MEDTDYMDLAVTLGTALPTESQEDLLSRLCSLPQVRKTEVQQGAVEAMTLFLNAFFARNGGQGSPGPLDEDARQLAEMLRKTAPNWEAVHRKRVALMERASDTDPRSSGFVQALEALASTYELAVQSGAGAEPDQ